MSSFKPCRVPVATVVTRLRQRPSAVQEALDGHVLTVQVMTADDPPPGYSMVFSPDGHISLFTPDDPHPPGLAPQVRLQGSPDQLVQVLLGETDTVNAVFRGLMDIFAPPDELTPHYPRLMRLVREEIWALLDEDQVG